MYGNANGGLAHAQVPALSDAAKVVVARYAPIEQCLWWYEDLTCGPVDAVIAERLDAGEDVRLNYGKLMERLMYFQRCASCSRPAAVSPLPRLRTSLSLCSSHALPRSPLVL